MGSMDYDSAWLGYDRLTDASRRARYANLCHHAYVSEESPELSAVREELRRGIGGLVGDEPHFWQHAPRSVEAFLAIGHPTDMRPIHETIDPDEVEAVHPDGFVLRHVNWNEQDVLVLTAPNDRGLVFGTFELLRRMQLGEAVMDIDYVGEPANSFRVINHWDNPFRRRVERGYAGESIFDWDRLPDLRSRYFDYARMLASVGINGIVPNNVNTGIPTRKSTNEATRSSSGWQLLASDNLDKLEALAGVFRRYGIRTYLSVNFAAPMLLGGLDTADPLDEDVEQWWHERADAIYERIPDFGGFLVKADSEGQPGPYDYDRDHADGANLLARALAPHDGWVFWRAFVYGSHEDRAVQAYDTFLPLDGEFHENVSVQIKNGPIDFQPREPISTLFGAMSSTDITCELQITQEYTGQAVHTCFHVPMWKEILDCDTHADGEDSLVKDILAQRDGQGLAGVSNIGNDPNWFGNYLSGANLYGFGRLAWDPDLASDTITDEWIKQTFSQDPTVVETIREILMNSWDATIQYETGGLGLMHMMYNGSAALENHYDPAPEEWPEYHGASASGIGIDRTSSGSGYTEQYPAPLKERYENVETCPEELLLFFHHLPWDFELEDGTPLIQRMYDNCYSGVQQVEEFRRTWEALEGDIDPRAHRHVAERLEEHAAQARWWCATICEFFYDHSGIPDENGRVGSPS